MATHDAHENASQPVGSVLMVMTLAQALQGLMETENELLRQLRLDQLSSIQAEKAALVEGYEQALAHLRRATVAEAGMSEVERCVIDAGVRELAAAARRNMQRLAQARATTDELIKAIDQSLSLLSRGSGLVPRPRLASGS